MHAKKPRKVSKAHSKVDALLINAIESGEATPMTKRDWQRIRREGLKRTRK